MRGMRWTVVPLVVVAVAVCAGAALAAPPAAEGLTTEQLVLQGATVKFQVDVNGEVAMQLVGGMLDAAADTVKQAAASAFAGDEVPLRRTKASGQGGEMGELAMAEPFIGPAKDLVKSLSRVTAVVMQAPPLDCARGGLALAGGDPELAEGPPDSKDLIGQYEAMMVARGWTMLATTRAITGQEAAAYVAPGGKGIFVAVRPNGQELIVALVTTREPIGDLLGQIVRAGGAKALPMLLAADRRGDPSTGSGSSRAESRDEQPKQECAEKPDDPSTGSGSPRAESRGDSDQADAFVRRSGTSSPAKADEADEGGGAEE